MNKKLNRAMSCGCIYDPNTGPQGQINQVMTQGKCQQIGDAASVLLEAGHHDLKHPAIVAWRENFDKHVAEIKAHPEWTA